MITADDLSMLELSLKEARVSAETGGRPIGAVLVIGGEVVASAANTAKDTGTAWRHAENTLLVEHSTAIVTARRQGKSTTLYTTIECCLMCLGSAIHHRVGRIVYACPDPVAGALNLEVGQLDPFSQFHWPTVEGGATLAFLADARGRHLLNESSRLFRKWVDRWQDGREKELAVVGLDQLRQHLGRQLGP